MGARYIDGFTLQLERVLPRFQTANLFGAVGLAAERFEAASVGALSRASLTRIVQAAATAAAAGPVLSRKTAEVVAARKAASKLARAAGFSAEQLAQQLGVHPQSIRRLAQTEAPARLIQAVQARLALEECATPAAHMPGFRA